jgi:hypothetical protein
LNVTGWKAVGTGFVLFVEITRGEERQRGETQRGRSGEEETIISTIPAGNVIWRISLSPDLPFSPSIIPADYRSTVWAGLQTRIGPRRNW